MQLKRLTAARGGVPAATIFYAVKGQHVVFTAANYKNSHYSSINSAEDIVADICRAERISVMTVTFWDLQTHLGYPPGRSPDAGYAPGQWGFDRLEIKWAKPKPEGVTVVDWKPFAVTEWIPEDCPPEVLTLFAKFIGTFVETDDGWRGRKPGRRDATWGKPAMPSSF